MALWLSGELYAPDDLHSNLERNLKAVREEFGGAIPQLGEIQFKSWWIPSMILILVTEELRQKILQNQPNEIDSLNTLFNATHMDTFRLNVGYDTVVYFEGLLHPLRLAEIYIELDGVTYANENSWVGDWSNVYPWRVENEITFLFREAWYDCPMCCAYSRFWYFRTHVYSEPNDYRFRALTAGQARRVEVEYLGRWEAWHEPVPAWWQEARVAYDQFHCEHDVCGSCP